MPDSVPVVDLKFSEGNWVLAFFGDYARNEFVTLICDLMHKLQQEEEDDEQDGDKTNDGERP